MRGGGGDGLLHVINVALTSMWCEVLLATVARKSGLDKFTTDTKTAKPLFLPIFL